MMKKTYFYYLAALCAGVLMGYVIMPSEKSTELLHVVADSHEVEVNWHALNRDNVNTQIDFGMGHTSKSPLMYAVLQNRPDMVKRCLALGADTEARYSVEYFGESQATPLHEAVKLGNLQIVQLLVQGGADLESRLYRDVQYCVPGYTPLMRAVELGFTDIARYLLEQGADATAVSDASLRLEVGDAAESVLQVALAHADCYELVREHLRKTRPDRLLHPSYEWGCFSLPDTELQQSIEVFTSPDAEFPVHMSKAELLKRLNSCYCILKVNSVTDYTYYIGRDSSEKKREFGIAEVLFSKEPMEPVSAVYMYYGYVKSAVANGPMKKGYSDEDVYICLKKEAFARLDKGLYINYYEVWDDAVYLAGKDVTEMVQALLQ